jgi:hypothetical protein
MNKLILSAMLVFAVGCGETSGSVNKNPGETTPNTDTGGNNNPNTGSNPPTSVTINAPTNSGQTITLTLSATGASEMKVSETADCSGGAWEPYATSKNLTSGGTQGLVTVSVKMRSSSLIESSCVTDSTTVDSVLPDAQTALLNTKEDAAGFVWDRYILGLSVDFADRSSTDTGTDLRYNYSVYEASNPSNVIYSSENNSLVKTATTLNIVQSLGYELDGFTPKALLANTTYEVSFEVCDAVNCQVPSTFELKTGRFIRDLSVGRTAMCFVKDSIVYCRGGDNTMSNPIVSSSSYNSQYVAVSGTVGAKSVTVGMDSFVCAVGEYDSNPANGNEVKCWGKNDNYQLGSDLSSGFTPRIVGSRANSSENQILHGVKKISLGTNHACALLTMGSVKCWGNNADGQLGDNTVNSSSLPVTVTGGAWDTALDIAVSASHSCAILANKTVHCWGANGSGQLGDGTTNPSLVAIQVSGLGFNAASIATKGSSTCALSESNAVKCWGDNLFGQLGDGTNSQSSSPVSVLGLSGPATQIVAGDESFCSLISNGTVQCWGMGAGGQLGDGNINDSSSPVNVSSLTGIQELFSSSYRTMCARDAASVKCWGENLTVAQFNLIKPALSGASDVYTTPTAISGTNY